MLCITEEFEIENQEEVEFPFDPSKIDITNAEFAVFNLVERIRNEEIDLMPDFQRMGNLWDEGKQSRLIESLILGIPLQSFYFDVERCRAADDDIVFTQKQVWHVVDGLQRLSSIRNFIIGRLLETGEIVPMRLTGLEYLKKLEGRTFSELPGSLQRSILEARVHLNLIRPGTPEDIKFNIFKRVNTGGLPLTRQEIRHALLHGKGTEALRVWAELDSFKKSTGGRVTSSRMGDREFINRFVAFYHQDIDDSYKSMDVFLNDSIRKLNRCTEEEICRIGDVLDDTLLFISDTLGTDIGFRRYQAERGEWGSQLNKAVFETLTSELARLTVEERRLLRYSCPFREQYSKFCKEEGDGSYSALLSRSTDMRGRVIARHKVMRDFLHGLLEGAR